MVERPLHVLTLSARSSEALREIAAAYADALAAPAADMADMAYVANAGRAHFDHRAALTAASAIDAVSQLRAVAAGDAQGSVLAARTAVVSAPDVVFVFAGQGSQYIDMGRQLYETQPTFRRALDRCAEILTAHVDLPLIPILFPPDGSTSPLAETAYAQPALFALEWALAELWCSWGVEPAALLGHSVGEYVAACRAGVFSLADGLKLVAAQGRLTQSLPRDGMMAAVLVAAERARWVLARLRRPGQYCCVQRSRGGGDRRAGGQRPPGTAEARRHGDFELAACRLARQPLTVCRADSVGVCPGGRYGPLLRAAIGTRL